MPKRSSKANTCPSCGTIVKEPYKTWELVAPFPNKKMRIAVATFGMYQCPSCGKKFRAVIAKVKLGAEGIEM